MELLAFRGGYDMKVVRIGLDIAKSVFQVHGVDAHGKAVLRKTLSRNEVLKYPALLKFRNIPNYPSQASSSTPARPPSR